MKGKIERLEDEDDQIQKGKKKGKKTKMCPDLTDKGYCEVGHEKCRYAHTAIELDLVHNMTIICLGQERKEDRLVGQIDHETDIRSPRIEGPCELGSV